MYHEAREYVEGFTWCAGIRNSYFGMGTGDVFAVFLFEIEPAGRGADRWIWVIVGDLPPAYIATELCPNPAAALDGYTGEMERWVAAARSGQSVADLIPVNAPATPEYVDMLESRLRFLDTEILAYHKGDLE